MPQVIDFSRPATGTPVEFGPPDREPNPSTAFLESEPPPENPVARTRGFIDPWYYEREAILQAEFLAAQDKEERKRKWAEYRFHRDWYRQPEEQQAQRRRQEFEQSGFETPGEFLQAEDAKLSASVVPGYKELYPMRVFWDTVMGVGELGVATAGLGAKALQSGPAETVGGLVGLDPGSVGAAIEDEVRQVQQFQQSLRHAGRLYDETSVLGLEVPIPFTEGRSLNAASTLREAGSQVARQLTMATAGGAPLMFGQIAAESYNGLAAEGEAAGLNADGSGKGDLYAAVGSGIEVLGTAAFSKLGMGGLEDVLMGTIRSTGKQMLHEGLEETFVEAGQATARYLFDVPQDLSKDAILEDLANIWAQSGTAVAMARGGQRVLNPQAFQVAQQIKQAAQQAREFAEAERREGEVREQVEPEVAQWMADNPEKLSQVAELPEEPSRKEFVEATGVEPSEAQNKEFRQQFRQRVVEQLQQQTAQEAEQETQQAQQEAQEEQAARQAVEQEEFQPLTYEEVLQEPEERKRFVEVASEVRNQLNETQQMWQDAYKGLMPADSRERGRFLKQLRKVYNEGGDPAKIKRFGEIVDAAMRHYPFIGGDDGSRSDVENAVWEFLLAGPPQRYTRNSPQVVDRSIEIINRMREDEFSRGGEVEGVPFDLVADPSERGGRKPRAQTGKYVMDYLKRFPRRRSLKPEDLNLDAVRPVAGPEAKAMLDELGVALRRKKLPSAFGGFSAQHLAVLVDPETIRNPHLFNKVLMHEIGHAIDFLGQDKTLKRGNLAGRFASLVDARQRMIDGLDDKVLREEALALSEWWKPGIYERGKQFQKYRTSSRELFADVMSVLLNSPGDVQARAPRIWEAWQTMMGQKPEVAEAYFKVQELLGMGEEAVGEQRTERIMQMHERGDIALAQKLEQEERARAGIIQSLVQWGPSAAVNSARKFKDALFATFIHKGGPVIARQKRALKQQGRDPKSVGPGEDAAIQLESLYRISGSLRALADRMTFTVLKPVQDAGLSRRDIGELLQHMRIVGGRGEIANPDAYTPFESNRQIQAMQRRMRPEQWQVLREAVDRFHQHVFEVGQAALESGIVSQEFFDRVIEPNKGNYAHFAVVPHIEARMPGSIKEMIGTFEDVGDPFLFTALKAGAIMHFAEMNRMRQKLELEHASTFVPSRELAPYAVKTPPPPSLVPTDTASRAAFFAHHRRQRDLPEEIKPGMKRVTIWQDGKAQDYAVPEAYEALFSPAIQDPFLAKALQMANTSVYGTFYPLYISYSPGFLVANPFRDLQATWVRLGAFLRGQRAKEMRRLRAQGHSKAEAKRLTKQIKLNSWDFFKEMRKSLPDAWSIAAQGYSDLVNELHDNRLLDPPYTSRKRWIEDEMMGTEFIDQLKERGVLAADRTGAAKAWDQVVNSTPEVVRKAGLVGARAMPGFIDLQEAAVKIAGIKAMRKAGLDEDTIRYGAHNMVGTQSTKFRGTGSVFINSAAMFFSAKMAALRAHVQLAKDADSRVSWMMRTAAMSLPSVALSRMAMAGYFGAAMRAMYLDIADDEEDMAWVWPIDRVRDPGDGELKTIYLNIPRDQTAALATTLLGKVFDASMKKDPGELQPFLDELAENTIGTMSPPFELASNWYGYFTGGIPYDAFFDRPIVPPEVLERGGWPAQRKMLAWTFRKFGGVGDFLRFATSPAFGEAFTETLDTEVEQAYRQWPGVSRLVRISNRGQKDDAYERQMLADVQRYELTQEKPERVRYLYSQWYRLNRLRLAAEREEVPITGEEQMRHLYLEGWRKWLYEPARDRAKRLQADGYYDKARGEWEELNRNSRLYMSFATAKMNGEEEKAQRLIEELIPEMRP